MVLPGRVPDLLAPAEFLHPVSMNLCIHDFVASRRAGCTPPAAASMRQTTWPAQRGLMRALLLLFVYDFPAFRHDLGSSFSSRRRKTNFARRQQLIPFFLLSSRDLARHVLVPGSSCSPVLTSSNGLFSPVKKLL